MKWDYDNQVESLPFDILTVIENQRKEMMHSFPLYSITVFLYQLFYFEKEASIEVFFIFFESNLNLKKYLITFLKNVWGDFKGI